MFFEISKLVDDIGYEIHYEHKSNDADFSTLHGLNILIVESLKLF